VLIEIRASECNLSAEMHASADKKRECVLASCNRLVTRGANGSDILITLYYYSTGIVRGRRSAYRRLPGCDTFQRATREPMPIILFIVQHRTVAHFRLAFFTLPWKPRIDAEDTRKIPGMEAQRISYATYYSYKIWIIVCSFFTEQLFYSR